MLANEVYLAVLFAYIKLLETEELRNYGTNSNGSNELNNLKERKAYSKISNNFKG